MKYRCWVKGQDSDKYEIEASSPRAAAATLAGSAWHDETWSGDDPVTIMVKNPHGALLAYEFSAELELRLACNKSTVIVNTGGGPAR